MSSFFKLLELEGMSKSSGPVNFFLKKARKNFLLKKKEITNITSMCIFQNRPSTVHIVMNDFGICSRVNKQMDILDYKSTACYKKVYETFKIALKFYCCCKLNSLRFANYTIYGPDVFKRS